MCPSAEHHDEPPRRAPVLDDVVAAARRIGGVVTRTPTLTSRDLDETFGCELFFKAENLQVTGSFKFRGAYNLVSQLDGAQRRAGLLTSSAGNHAQAVALAGRVVGAAVTVLMPLDAPEEKRRATERLGAKVVEFDRYSDDPEVLLRELAVSSGATVVHPYDDAHIIAGAGTAALELLDDAGPLDACLVPVGGGGLLAGFAVATSDVADDMALVGVEPSTSDDWSKSMAVGSRVRVEVRDGLADGQQLAIPGELPFALAAPRLQEIAVVEDTQTRAAMRTLAEELHVVVEPSGATAFAAIHSGRLDLSGRRVGVVLSGGNISLRRLYAATGQS